MKTKNFISVLIIGIFFIANSIAQVPSYVPTSGLKVWLGFNGNTNDLSGNANNATNTSTTFIADRNGNANAAADFNGSSSFLQITTPSFSFSPTGAFTYSFWMNKQTQTTASGIVMMSGVGTTGVFITLIQGASGFTFGTNKQQSTWFYTSCAHTLNVWDHYVTTFNAGVMKIYKNGVFQSTITYTHTGATTAVLPFLIGRGIGGANTSYKGALDDIGIWDRELSQTEINGLFSSITAVQDLKSESVLSIYPNPATDVINISIQDAKVGLNFQIVDAQGRKVKEGIFTSSVMNIDIKALPAGVYFVEIGTQQTRSYKFIKKQE